MPGESFLVRGLNMLLFSVNVIVEEVRELKSGKGQINMILFSGFVDAPIFKGKILSGACDTQKYLKGERGELSARYMLDGLDAEGTQTRLFIENNAYQTDDGSWKTTPRIFTDNEKLDWLENVKLSGQIEGTDNGVIIHFYEDEK